MNITRAFIEKIPKTDLHVHLDGSMRLSTLLELAKENNVAMPADSEDGLKKTVFKETYKDLGEYLRGFAYTTAVLQDSLSLERVAFELAEDNMAEGVRYLEVRFAPQLHQSRRLSIIETMNAVHSGLDRAKKRFNSRDEVKSGAEPSFNYGLIVCAMRMFDAKYSKYFKTLLDVHKHSEPRWIFSIASLELVKAAVEARDRHSIPVVGYDLAGKEKGYPASYFKEAYSLAHKNFLKKTVHAGEDYGPESIFQAITDLHSDRIGHGVHLFNANMIKNPEIEDKEAYIENLVRFMGDRRITVEVCLSSNMQTNPSLDKLEQHSFDKMRKAGLSVTFCTDNRTISSTTVTDEVVKAVETYGLSGKELKDFVIYGFKRSFYPGSYLEKRRYVRMIIDYYEALEKELH